MFPGTGAFNHPPDAILKTEQGYEYEGQNMAQVRGGGSSPAAPGVRSWKISTASGVMTFIQFDVAERTSGYVLYIEGRDPLPLASLPLITLSEGEFGNRDTLLARLLVELPDSYFPTSLPRDKYLKFGDMLEVTDNIEMSVINSTFGGPGSGSIAGQRRFEFTYLLRNTSGGQAVRSPQLWITYVTNIGERDGPIQVRSSEIGPLQEQEVVQALSLDEQIHTVLLSVWTQEWEHIGTFYIP